MNIVLTGFMGTGKSETGRLLSERLKRPFFDTDEMIEKQTGFTVAQIFEKTGEESFRQLESQTIRLVSALDNAVIATGGGAPVREENMRELEKNGVVVFLKAEPSTILDRLRSEIQTRPLLKAKSPAEALETLLNSRRKAYSRCRYAVDTDGLSPEKVAEKVFSLTRKDLGI